MWYGVGVNIIIIYNLKRVNVFTTMAWIYRYRLIKLIPGLHIYIYIFRSSFSCAVYTWYEAIWVGVRTLVEVVLVEVVSLCCRIQLIIWLLRFNDHSV